MPSSPKSNYILTFGDREVEHQKINLRTRENAVLGEMELDAFLEAILKEKRERALVSPFHKEE